MLVGVETIRQHLLTRKWGICWILIASVSIAGPGLGVAQDDETCVDDNGNCPEWIDSDKGLCLIADSYVAKSCRRSCRACRHLPKKFDITRLPPSLQPVGWLLGVWRSEHGGKAVFPTIPKFTYGEEIQFSIPSRHMGSVLALNYTAVAWGHNEGNLELHSENGYLAVQEDGSRVALTTVMNNGFVTVEEGQVSGEHIRFHLRDIGRISFSRDLPVNDLVRVWTLLDSRHLEARLSMATLTHGMQPHTSIIYERILP